MQEKYKNKYGCDHDILNAVRYLKRYNVNSYIKRMSHLFNTIDIYNKDIIDIGCGRGAISIWTALTGANHVVAIDPDAEGGDSGRINSLKSIVKELKLENKITVLPEYFQKLQMEELPVEKFDVAIMYNFINHLDEKAVSKLHYDKSSYRLYMELLMRLYEILNPGGTVIIADCGRSNFWPKLGLQSPFLKTIEWEKHQDPKIWRSVFEDAGFRFMDLRWSPLYPLGMFTSNKVFHYFTISHFVLRFKK